jgi:hypothetical protein
MIAEIASGETDWADIFFLVALILFVLGAIGASGKAAVLTGWAVSITCLGFAFTALGLLVL